MAILYYRLLYNLSHIEKLANLILNDCLQLVEGDYVIVEGMDVPPHVLIHFSGLLSARGLKPLILFKSNAVSVFNNNQGNDQIVAAQSAYELSWFKLAKAFIGLREPDNLYELSRLSSQARERLLIHYLKPVHFEYRNHNLQWLYVRLPSPSLVKRMDDNDSEEYFKSIFISYKTLESAMMPLVNRLGKTSRIRIVSDGTHLELKSSNTGVYNSVGRHNLPDGEIFISPLKNSMNGQVTFNIPSTYLGNYFENVKLVFEEGKVVDATSSDTERLNELLNTDEGARYCGEFAFGMNPYVVKPINDILYDEKMAGSFHLALGNAYPEADNGNKSGIHWDLIHDLKNRGSKIFFDDELVMKGGLFIAEDLLDLNPEKLKHRLI